ncbi:N,N'-diacetyllegionaminic acid synthase [compost metagenome]
MVSAIRDIEICLGDGIKRPTASESHNKIVARKSLVLARDVAAGEPLALTCKRPGNGVSPYLYWQLSGTPANRQYAADEILDA